MTNGHQELPVSTRDGPHMAHYQRALLAYQTHFGDPVEHVDAALAQQPDFVLGHVFRAIALYVLAERRFERLARPSLEAAEALAGAANAREQGLIRAARALVEGRWQEACGRFDEVLVGYPTDAFALQSAHLMDFVRGDALNLRNRVARVLPYWTADDPGYSYVLGMYAFGLEECNQYPEAEDYGRRALALDARDPWSVHAVTHVMEMQGRREEGVDFLESRTADWAPDNGFAYHNWWHLCLFYLDQGDEARVLQIFDEQIQPEAGSFAMGLVDITALLWRLKLLGINVGQRFDFASEKWAAHLDTEGGYYAFNDFHAALAFAGAGRLDLLAEVQALAQAASHDSTPTNEQVQAAVGAPLISGIHAYAAGRYAEAMQSIAEVRDGAHRFGGSHAQRDVISLTLIDAAVRAGEAAAAQHFLNEREMFKPASELGRRLLRAASR
jgi:tetratricopeptide (TPR) repeat protein